MTKRAQFSAIDTSQSIDSEKGIIYGVSVITVGEAETHDLWVDNNTLLKLSALSNGGVKVKMNHPQRGEQPPVQGTAGQLINFRIEGGQLRADLELLKSEEYFDKIIEMAQKMPTEFGLSVRIAYGTETIDEKDYIRPTAIESADLVDTPAANPNGLFSIINKPKQKPMSAVIAKALGLAENATEDQVAAEITKRLEANKPADITGFSKQIEEFSKRITDLDTKAKEAELSARKTEIAALVAEASRDGKVIPLTDAQLAKMDVADIKEMITKLTKQVQMSRKAELPRNKEGSRLRGADLVDFCQRKQAEGAEALTAKFNEQFKNNN